LAAAVAAVARELLLAAQAAGVLVVVPEVILEDRPPHRVELVAE